MTAEAGLRCVACGERGLGRVRGLLTPRCEPCWRKNASKMQAFMERQEARASALRPSMTRRPVIGAYGWEHDEAAPALAGIGADRELLAQPKNERRQYGVTSVRAWFRQLRAAEFERDVQKRTAYSPEFRPSGLSPLDDRARPRRFTRLFSYEWTLFDTQQVVNNETDRNYNPFARSVIPWFRSHVVGDGRGITFADLNGWFGESPLR